MLHHKKQRPFPLIKNGRFYNYEGEHKPAFFIPSMYMMLKSQFLRKPEYTNIQEWMAPEKKILHSSEQLQITWIGHSTFLIQIAGFNILTDPIFDNISPIFPRTAPAGIALHELPPIDIVLISHNHRDHMDARSLLYLRNKNNTTFLVPQADKAWFVKRGFERVYELSWWEKHRFFSRSHDNVPLECHFLPALHWSQRGIFDYNKSLWGSWMIKLGQKLIYFAGDTAYWDHFKAIADEFGPIDIALMPIGPCEPRYWMKNSHISAEDAVVAFKELQAQTFIPMHWGTYYLGADDFILPLNRLQSFWNEQTWQGQKMHTLKFGQRMTFADQFSLGQPERFTSITL